MTGELAICATFKDEGSDILEWVAYHWAVGFEKFFLYDNGSSDFGCWRIRNSNLSRFVTIVDWPKEFDQLDAYRHFCREYAGSAEFVAFIDIDEFVYPTSGLSVKEALKGFRKGATILVQWLTFGPSGHNLRPPGLVLENYTLRLQEDHRRCGFVKSIVSMSRGLAVGDTPHVVGGAREYVNTRNELVPPHAELPPCHDNIVINHYYTKSLEDWQRKKSRGTAISPRPNVYYTDADFAAHAGADTHDTRIQRFLPQVKYCLRMPRTTLKPHGSSTPSASPGYRPAGAASCP